MLASNTSLRAVNTYVFAMFDQNYFYRYEHKNLHALNCPPYQSIVALASIASVRSRSSLASHSFIVLKVT